MARDFFPFPWDEFIREMGIYNDHISSTEEGPDAFSL